MTPSNCLALSVARANPLGCAGLAPTVGSRPTEAHHAANCPCHGDELPEPRDSDRVDRDRVRPQASDFMNEPAPRPPRLGRSSPRGFRRSPPASSTTARRRRVSTGSTRSRARSAAPAIARSVSSWASSRGTRGAFTGETCAVERSARAVGPRVEAVVPAERRVEVGRLRRELRGLLEEASVAMAKNSASLVAPRAAAGAEEDAEASGHASSR